MFGLIGMLDDYESRKVAKDEFTIKNVDWCISTAYVADSSDPYETCVFWDDESRVVETYLTKESAKVGHQKWVNFIKVNQLTSLENYQDQGTNIFSEILRAFDQ